MQELILSREICKAIAIDLYDAVAASLYPVKEQTEEGGYVKFETKTDEVKNERVQIKNDE
jgi:hypothetical protein